MLKRNFQLGVVEYFFPKVLEKFPQVVIDEQGVAQDAHDLEHGSVQMQVVLDEFIVILSIAFSFFKCLPYLKTTVRRNGLQ